MYRFYSWLILKSNLSLKPILPPSTNKKNPFEFFCKILIAFSVISVKDGSPAGSKCLSVSYCIWFGWKRPLNILKHAVQYV